MKTGTVLLLSRLVVVFPSLILKETIVSVLDEPSGVVLESKSGGLYICNKQ